MWTKAEKVSRKRAKEWGQRVAARRKELGYTREMLAKKTGISHIMIINYEEGVDRLPSQSILLKVATGLKWWS
jgi:transcriptional regulator with XRE-family HTH domain